MSSPTSWNLSPRSTAIRPSAQLRANRAITPHNSCSARPRRRRGTMTTIERDAATPPAWLRHVRSRTSPPDLTTIEGRLARVALILLRKKRHRPGGPYAPSRYLQAIQELVVLFLVAWRLDVFRPQIEPALAHILLTFPRTCPH